MAVSREHARAYRLRKRLELSDWVNGYKSRHGCQACGEVDPIVLDFHHVDESTKTSDISQLVSQAKRVPLYREIEKCIIVCSNCHRRIHAGRPVTIRPRVDGVEQLSLKL